jgi:LysM repeat protein
VTNNLPRRATDTTSASSITSPPASCSGKTYTIKSGDTCQSVSFSQGIDTAQLLSANNLPAFCANFPTSGSLCIPTAYQCTSYTVHSTDTCTTISVAHNLTWTQLISWNPELGTRCENIAEYTGYTICLSNPGGSWVNPYPTTSTIATTTPEYSLSLLYHRSFR